jgi:hypothetical protein
MSGTGLEPVTPSLSRWSSRSRRFAQVRSDRNDKRNPTATERLSERERTTFLAILATSCLGSTGYSGVALAKRRAASSKPA